MIDPNDDNLRLLPSNFDYHGLMGVRAGAQRLLNIDPSWEAVATRLQGHSLFQVMNTTGRIDALLREHGSADLEAQLRIAAGLMGAETATKLGRRLLLMQQRMAEEGDGSAPGVVLFSHLQLATLLQIASNVLGADSTDGGIPLDGLGEALLIINDLMEPALPSPGEADYNTPDGRKTWIYYLSVVAVVAGSYPTAHLMVRAADLFLSNQTQLREHEAYIDLLALFEEATGLDANAYVLAMVIFLGTLYAIKLENVNQLGATLSESLFSGPPLRFGPADTDRFFALGGLRIGEFVNRMRAAYSDGIRPQYQLPLEQSPLVRVDVQAVCLSVSLLERRMTDGLYHILLNARAGPDNRLFRDRFMRFVGRVFADYVEHSLGRIAGYELSRNRGRSHGGRPARRVIGDDAIQAAATGRHPTPALCDTILVSGEDLLLVESKAKILSLNARAGGNPEEFFTRVDEIFVEGARQLESTLDFVLAGGLNEQGIDPRRIRRVFPIVASLQDFTWNPVFRAWLDDRLKDEGLLQRRSINRLRVAQLEALDVGDVEWLELAVEHGNHTAAELLATKQADRFGRWQSFTTWSVMAKTPRFQSTDRSSYHMQRYEQLSSGALNFFRTRAQPT